LTSRVSFYNEDITLAAHNQRFQIIICTNVLMYYEKDFRKSIIGGLIETLDRDGFLFIESAGTKSMKELGLIRLSPASHFFQKTEQLFKEQGVK
jgi:chemotaxis methyl-accepting protein methylase